MMRLMDGGDTEMNAIRKLKPEFMLYQVAKWSGGIFPVCAGRQELDKRNSVAAP